ncbi:MAG: hypothetical protein ACREBU_15470 [Nitrososphaera sp.]
MPITARFLSKLPQDILVSLPGYDRMVTVHMQLPFTWQLFFFGATFMAIANAIFMVRCPEIIRKYKDFSMFQTEGRSTEQLRDLYLRWVAYASTAELSDVRNDVREFYRNYCTADSGAEDSLSDHNVALVQIVSDLRLDKEKLNGAFWHVLAATDRTRDIARCMCLVFYGLGICLVAAVAVQNVCYVLMESNIDFLGLVTFVCDCLGVQNNGNE